MKIGDRFEEIIAQNRLNYRSLSNKLGFSDTAIRKIAKGINEPKFEVLEAVHREFPDVNLHWLITGEGSINGIRGDFEDVLKFLEENMGELVNYPRFQRIMKINEQNKTEIQILMERLDALEKKFSKSG